MAHAPKTRSEKAVLSARRAWCYLVLVLISRNPKWIALNVPASLGKTFHPRN